MPDETAESNHVVLDIQDSYHTMSSGQVTLTVYRSVEQLLSLSRSLIEDGESSVATILLHTAAEIAAESCYSAALSASGLERIETPLSKFVSSYNLANERNRNLYNALANDEIQGCVHWADFKESAKRRNRIVHSGLVVTRDDAESSFTAASEVIAHLRAREAELRST